MNKQELASKVWNIANVLRKKIKASEYKDYILGLMFYKYLSDKELELLVAEGGSIDELVEDDDITKTFFKDKIGYYISKEDLFNTWRKKDLKLGAKDLAVSIEHFNQNINPNFNNVFEGVFSTLESGLTKLGENSGSRDKAVRDLVNLVAEIPATSKDYDVMGFIYEFLLQKFSNDNARDGNFYTPHEIVKLISRVIADRMKDKETLSIYDPCLGSAGLLLSMGEEAERYIDPNKIRYYGQELITDTFNLARENLIMKGINAQNICVRNGDTLGDDWPYFDDETPYEPLYVDAVACNPPYSALFGTPAPNDDPRFKGYGIPPKSKADYAFLLHCLYHLKPDGMMGIILPHGVLFRGDSEGEIRKNLIENRNIETIVGISGNCFLNTGIPVVILFLSKGRQSDDVLFIDASQCYEKVGKLNVLREQDIQKIFDTIKERKTVENFSRLVTKEEIVANDYNLNIPRYVSAKPETSFYDLYSIMSGRLSEKELARFNRIWDSFPELKTALLDMRDGYASIKKVDIKSTVMSDTAVQKFIEDFNAKVASFKDCMYNYIIRKPFDRNVRYKLNDTLFAMFDGGLVDKYDVYQQFASRWNEIAADGEMIATSGKDICRRVEPNMVSKTVKDQLVEEQKGWKGVIFPLDMIKKEYFRDDYIAMEECGTKASSKNEEWNELFEGLNEDAKQSVCKEDSDVLDTGKLKKAIKAGEFGQEVMETLMNISALIDEEKAENKKVKEIEKALDDKAVEKIKNLSDQEIDDMLVKKLITPVTDAIGALSAKVLTDFIKALSDLEKKYEYTLEGLGKEIKETSTELSGMVGQLEGKGSDAEALKMLMELLS